MLRSDVSPNSRARVRRDRMKYLNSENTKFSTVNVKKYKKRIIHGFSLFFVIVESAFCSPGSSNKKIWLPD